MTSVMKWTFRILFLLTIVYHFWSLATSGLDAFTPLVFKSLTATIIGSAINYLIQVGLPLAFLYIGFIKRDIKDDKKDRKVTSSYPKIRIG